MQPRAEKYLRWLECSPYSLWLLGVMSFLETIIVPIPIEVVLVPFMVANPDRIWRIAGVAMAGCVLAALVGYGVGQFLYESVGQWFLQNFSQPGAYESYQDLFGRHGFLAVLVVAIVPIPFQLAMLAAGAADYPLPLFVLATLIARGIRYFGLGWLVKHYGSQAKALWKEHRVAASLVAAAAITLLVLGTRYAADALV